MSQAVALFLGALLSGLVGASLFFIQRWVQKRDDERNLLFRIYQTLRDPLGFHERELRELEERDIEIFRKWMELEGLSLLVKDKDLRKDIYLIVRLGPGLGDIESVLKKIEKKLNKKLLTEIRKEEKAAAKPSPPISK
jgi:hypothetical protein